MNKEIKNNKVCSLCIWIFIAEQLQSNNGYGSGVVWLKGPNMSWFKITTERFFNTVPDHFFLIQISDFHHHCMPDGDESAYSELETSLVSWCKTTFCLIASKIKTVLPGKLFGRLQTWIDRPLPTNRQATVFANSLAHKHSLGHARHEH